MSICKTPFMILVLIICFAQFSFAQKITEEEYLKVDKEIWEKYEQDMGKLSEVYKNHPDKKDSLIVLAKQIETTANEKNIEAAIKYASVPSGLKRLFTVRLKIPKDTIRFVLKNLPDSMQASPYGKSLFFHLESEQIVEGNKYYDFKAIDSDGKVFTLSSLKGKRILFIYGGLSCMGQEGRDYLNKIYKETSRDNFEIVTYCLDSDLESLQENRDNYSCDYFLVSDFLQDHNPVKILYGAQALPTCFFIDEEGIVRMKTVGLNEEQINSLLAKLN